MTRQLALWLSVLSALTTGVQTALAAPISDTLDVSFVATPGAATGDVAVVGGALFVGVGPFGGATQSVVRIDGAGTTVIAEDFNSLGGFDYDAINDRLIVGDNALEAAGAITGDTVYAISNPFGSPASPISALGIEILDAGDLEGFADLVLDPTDPTGDMLFASDAPGAFPAVLGRVVQIQISTGTITEIQTGLFLAAGLATDGTTLYIGDVLVDFSSELSEVPLATPGAVAALLTALPGGIFDIEVEADGTLLVSSGGSILRIDPSAPGTPTVVASGFGFATSIDVGDDGTIYALDGFAAPGEADRVWVFSAVPEPATAAMLGLGLLALGAKRRGGAQSASVARREN